MGSIGKRKGREEEEEEREKREGEKRARNVFGLTLYYYFVEMYPTEFLSP